MRKPIIAGNWKMNMLPGDAVGLVSALGDRLKGFDEVEVVVCPPFVDIPAVASLKAEQGMGIGIGAQNMHWEDSGAFTGEISPEMLLDLEVGYVIIGHSERRQFFGETDQGVNRKVKSAIAHGIVPIICVGETLKQREAGEMENVVTSQVKCGLFEVAGDSVPQVVIAYEPIWAIGTGKAATVQDAGDAIGLIRNVLAEEFGDEVAGAVRIQYGGSVKPDNIRDFMEQPDIDGALVGGASLKAEDFARIVKYR